MKNIVIAGGSGYIGTVLSNFFTQKNYHVTIFSRSKKKNTDQISYVQWDGETLGEWTKSLEGVEALINLTGKSVDCRYTKANKQAIYDSRINATNILGKAVQNCSNPPKVWINAGSATIYPNSLDLPMTEEHTEFDLGFSVDVCRKWEATFNSFKFKNTRQIILRIAIVIGKSGGALVPLHNLAKVGLGGKQGKGNQMFSWIHEDDLATIFDECITNQSLNGVYNASSPNPVTNQVFMKTVRETTKTSVGLNLPTFLLEIGAKIIGTETELIFKSRFVIPDKLIKAGFKFKYPQVHQALDEILL